MKRFFDFILFGNIYVALGAVSLIQSTCIQLQISSHLFYYCLFVFFSTLFIYNLQRIFYKKAEDNSYNSVRRQWIFKNQKTIKLLTLLGFAGAGVFFFFNDYKILFYLSPLFVLSLAYFIPAIKLRKSAFLKLFTLALVWGITTAVVPALLNISVIDYKFVLHTLTRFCFILSICIPFDIRDIAIDTAENVSTLPNKYGETITRNIALFFTVIYGVLIGSEYYFTIISFPVLVGLLISMVATFLFILFASSKRSEYYYVAGIDGTMILQGLILMLISMK